jgi:hypothetical protein
MIDAGDAQEGDRNRDQRERQLGRVALVTPEHRLQPGRQPLGVGVERQVDRASDDGQHRQHDERDQHDRRALVWLEVTVRAVIFVGVVPTCLAVEDHDHLDGSCSTRSATR